MFNKKKWKLILYYNGVKIKKVRIRDNDDITAMSIRVLFHKELFGNNNVRIFIKPTKLLRTDEDKKETHWGVIFEKGVDINGE